MYFIIILLCSSLVPFLFIKSHNNWLIWAPTLIFTTMSLSIGLKAKFLPAPEMAVLGEIVYFMIFGVAAIGSLIGSIIVRSIRKKHTI